MGDIGPLPPPPPSPSLSATYDNTALRVLTHNIRYAATSLFPNEQPWSVRRGIFLSHLRYHTRHPESTIICLQEVLHSQLGDIVASLNTSPSSSSSSSGPSGAAASSSTSTSTTTWNYVGVGRNDGKTQGEYAPIFFRDSAWRQIHFETVWLNESRAVGKRGWDAASVRILSCLVLERRDLPECRGVEDEEEEEGTIKTSPTRILVLNTHLDDQGKVSRAESAKLILKVYRSLRDQYLTTQQQGHWDAVVLAGDLNSKTTGEAYQILNDSSQSGFVDSLLCIGGGGGDNQNHERYGDFNTFTGFDNTGDGEGLKRIDFVFVGVEDGQGNEQDRPKRAAVTGYAVLPNRFEEGIYMSDHRAVVADLII